MKGEGKVEREGGERFREGGERCSLNVCNASWTSSIVEPHY